MATVGITKELRQRTGNVIDKMRRAEIAADLPDYEKTYSMDAAHLYHVGCWGAEHLHLLDKIPKDWLAQQKTVGISIISSDNNKTKIEFTGVTGYARPSKDYWNNPSSTLTIDELKALPDDMLGKAEALKRWDDHVIVEEMNTRGAKVAADIDDFLLKCKSLNEAVKLFPTVRMYIDKTDIERLERKIERPAQRRAIVESYDTEELTAAAMAAKLAMAS